MSGGRRPQRAGVVDESSKEVEELLSAAQDQMLLDISIGSHTTRSCPLDSDLARRFEALKVPSSSAGITSAPLQAPVKKEGERSIAADAEVDEELKRILGADLSARFAALKGTSSSSESQSHPQRLGDEEADVVVGDDGVSKKEVDKVMQWAMDAARLDPSVSSDDEDNDDDDDSEDEDVKKGQSKKINGKRPFKLWGICR